MTKHLLRLSTIIGAMLLLSGCNWVVMNPSGDIAKQQANLIVYATILMLIVIVPVMALTIFFAFKYRADNKNANYEPEWHHSISLEIVIWSVPMAIIICLAGLTWVATHRLEPYDNLRRISAEKPIDSNLEPLRIQAVAMDWKWLFIYPDLGVAAINELAAPVDRPIKFEITSTTVMNSLYIPALAGQIYAMAGMQTELNAVINEPGSFEGFSANYSGAGFSQMHFMFHSSDKQSFENWVAELKAKGTDLDRPEFLHIDQPSIAHPVTYYANVDEGLWDLIINRCVNSSKLCQDDMMMVDALGGGGLEGLYNREAFANICSAEDPATFLLNLRNRKQQQVQLAELPIIDKINTQGRTPLSLENLASYRSTNN